MTERTHDDVNQRLREAFAANRGITVDGSQPSEASRALMEYARKRAARNTFTTDLSGRLTHIEGRPVEGGGGRG